ncbi:MAG: NLP/P60 hydrolase, partial [Mangrovicoccus sp.]
MITDTQPRRVIAAVTDIRDTPGGNRLRQLLFGEPVIILQDGVDHQLIEAKRDGYRGYVPKADLGPAMAATHRVTVLATHLYTAPDIRTADVMSLSFGAKLTLKEPIGAFCETQEGFF